MMAWGMDCSAWDFSVDEASLGGQIPNGDFVITTWHDNEPVEEAFWFAQFCAVHPS